MVGFKSACRAILRSSWRSRRFMAPRRWLWKAPKHLGELKDEVTSPGGTTIAGIYAMEQKSFRGTVMDAVVSATKRSQELGKGSAVGSS